MGKFKVEYAFRSIIASLVDSAANNGRHSARIDTMKDAVAFSEARMVQLVEESDRMTLRLQEAIVRNDVLTAEVDRLKIAEARARLALHEAGKGPLRALYEAAGKAEVILRAFAGKRLAPSASTIADEISKAQGDAYDLCGQFPF